MCQGILIVCARYCAVPGTMKHLRAVIKVAFIGAGSIEFTRDHVYQAALMDPDTAATLTVDQTVALCDDLLEAHREVLPPALLR